MLIKFQLEKKRLMAFSWLMSTSALFGMQTSLTDFFHENKTFVACAAAFSAIIAPSYIYYKQIASSDNYRKPPLARNIVSKKTQSLLHTAIDTYKQVTGDIVYQYKSMVAASIGNWNNFQAHVNVVNYADIFKAQDASPSKTAFDKVLPQVQQFIDSCTPPDDLLRKVLEKQDSFSQKERATFNCFAEDSSDFRNSFYVEEGHAITSMLGARRMQKLIDQEGYTTIGVPKKYLTLSNLDEKQWIIVGDKISSPPTSRPHIIGMQQMRELVDFVDKTGYITFGQWQVDHSNSKILFCGSELWNGNKCAFSLGDRTREYNVKKLKEFLLKSTREYKVTQLATEYLDQKIDELKNLHQTREKYSIPYRKDLDDNPNLDNKAMYQFLRVYNCSQRNNDSMFWDKHEFEEHIV